MAAHNADAQMAAYEALRCQIADGTLPGGTWVREEAVAKKLRISRTPVREALRTLDAEGLIEIVRYRGARVISWHEEDIDEVYRLRALMEGYGARLAARFIDSETLVRLRELEELFEDSVAERPVDFLMSAVECNNEFHAVILRASRSSRLVTLLSSIASVPLVQRAFEEYSEVDLQRSIVQHRDIITALEHGDETLADMAMRTHILAARYSALRAADKPMDEGKGLALRGWVDEVGEVAEEA